MANEIIKNHAREQRVYLWEVAARYGITDSLFSRKLRIEFSPEEQKKAMRFIDEIAAERTMR